MSQKGWQMKYQKFKNWDEIRRGDIGIGDGCIWVCLGMDIKNSDKYRMHIERGVEIVRSNTIRFYEDEPWRVDMYHTKTKRGKQ